MTASDLFPLAAGLQRALADIVGSEHLLCSAAHRLAYARDRLPYGTFRLREGALPGHLPAAVVLPADEAQLIALVQLAQRERLPLIPFGAGSGVLGGTVPLLGRELVVDLKRLNRLLEVDALNGTATVQAGLNGAQFEAALNERGFTAGHYPQSITMSTVGGWAACRGAGQASSRYGKIEDMVLGLKAVLPDGQRLVVRPVARRSVGPSLKDLWVGSEGTLGFITELTLRIWRKPEFEQGQVLAIPSLEAGLELLREVMQSELRPQVARLYDAAESAARTEGVSGFDTQHPILCILKFAGPRRLALLEAELALEIAARHGARSAGSEPCTHWEATRFESYSTKWQTEGHHMDTIEVAAPWSALPALYCSCRDAVRSLAEGVHFGVHWSHVYPEGACQYMTLRLPPMDAARALALHRQAWDRVQRLTLDAGGSIAHHHGAGWFRGPWMAEELGGGLPVLQAIKDALDPHNLLNPGKLGLRA
ncbi:MAG: FAD-binding oxidoreductase [Rubrivivax sp.]